MSDRTCPMCGTPGEVRVCSVPLDDVWRALATEFGVSLSAELRSRYTPPGGVELRRCDRCDLEYFSPHNQGRADFYEALMAQLPYEGERWEFDVVHGRLRPDDAVVDYGCGDGAFLRRVAGTVNRATGVDLNSAAVAALRDRGFEAFCGRPADFVAQTEARFDVACAFQIVEHLTSVDDLLSPLRARLNADGRVFISVPNRHRLGQGPLEPLDCPPHHVSRWSATALERLAGRYGLDLVRIDYAPPTYAEASAELRRRLQGATARAPRWASRAVTRALRMWLLSPRRHAELSRRNWWQVHHVTGHTMLAELRMPSPVP